jgi:aspartyl/asparaginyl beta-hydroxylase (cupin superfamily)
MKLTKGKVIGKHSDKIDKDIESGNIFRVHIPIRTNKDVIFTLYESSRDKQGHEHNLKTGHFYYTDVSKPHAVRNMSKEDRIHLVVDCKVNTAIRTLIA